jgi:hypothetical protein
MDDGGDEERGIWMCDIAHTTVESSRLSSAWKSGPVRSFVKF